MASSRLLARSLIALAVAASATAARAQEDDPPVEGPRRGAPSIVAPRWPNSLPEGWRMLGDDEPLPGQTPPALDSGRDGRFAPPNAVPPSGALAPRRREPATKDEATLKAEREKARAQELRKALEPKPDPAVLRAQALDALFARLAAAPGPAEAAPVAAAIQRIWMQPQSDTATLIMQRAMAATQARRYDAALALLDRLTAIAPDWAEAWSERASVRFLADDPDGAIADIDRAMRLEPRHYGALANLGALLQRAGSDDRALDAYEKALKIYPAQPELKALAEKLGLKVRGRDI